MSETATDDITITLTREQIDALVFHHYCGLGVKGPGDRGISYECDCTDEQRTHYLSALTKALIKRDHP